MLDINVKYWCMQNGKPQIKPDSVIIGVVIQYYSLLNLRLRNYTYGFPHGLHKLLHKNQIQYN